MIERALHVKGNSIKGMEEIMMKKIVLMLMVVVLAGAYFAKDAAAVRQYFVCKVEMTGATDVGVLVCLSDTASSPTFTNRWFKALTGEENRLLASALMALNSGMDLGVVVDLSEPGYGNVYAAYVMP
jgi:hypothetical protein